MSINLYFSTKRKLHRHVNNIHVRKGIDKVSGWLEKTSFKKPFFSEVLTFQHWLLGVLLSSIDFLSFNFLAGRFSSSLRCLADPKIFVPWSIFINKSMKN